MKTPIQTNKSLGVIGSNLRISCRELGVSPKMNTASL